MLTITKLQNWANAVPANIKAIVAAHLSKMDFSYMVLDEDTHTYTSTKNPEVQWTSVTTLIKHYRPEQDWDRIASTWGKSHGVQTHVVREMWEHNADCAAATGSVCHLFGEFICNIMINLMLCKSIGEDIAKHIDNVDYISIDFKKKDGFLKTNKISKDLNLYRQNYCGCKFAKGHLVKQ